MPYAAKRPCTEPGCRELVASGKCEHHRQRRPSRQARGYGAKYERARRKAINRDKACARCGSDERLVAHHIDANPNNNDPDNLVTLCRDCHERHHGRMR